MKRVVGVLSLLLVLGLVSGLVVAGVAPEEALTKLLQGNMRCVSGQYEPERSGEEYRKELAKGQSPHAVVVACSDSRVAPEIIFDQDLGQIFVVRTAGNVVDSIALGSIEYAVEHLHAPLVLVLGHESCGAVKATVDHKGKPEGNIGTIIKKIMPAVERAKKSLKPGDDLVHLAVLENVKEVAKDITKKSHIIAHEVKEDKVKLVGAYYSISTGRVEMVALK